VWKFVEQADSLGIKDIDSPAKRPSAHDALEELNGSLAPEWLVEAKHYLDLKDYVKALPPLQKGADAGDAVAMNSLGYLYEKGLGVAQNYSQARQWFQKAAKAGNATAMANLGMLYRDGSGAAGDYDKAREWFQKAADAGNTVAMNNLGWLYANGRGVARDYDKAREWCQKAAEAGNKDAKQALERLGQK
jgi:TPR repeat protein